MNGRDVAVAIARSPIGGYVAEVAQAALKPKLNVLLVLTYHRVDERRASASAYDGLISASPGMFRAQMEWLVSRYRVVPIEDVVGARRGISTLPPGAVLITFDDAYRDFAEHAWPVLRDLGMPVTLFVPTAFPDSGRAFWWDRLWACILQARQLPSVVVVDGRPIRLDDPETGCRRIVDALKGLPHVRVLEECDRLADALGEESPASSPVLSWNELRLLAAEGVSLAPHSDTHPRFDRVAEATVVNEVNASVSRLRDAVGRIAPVFAYPDGAGTEVAVRAVEGAGLAAAFTTRRGRNILGSTPWYELRRINVGARANVNSLAVQLGLLSTLPARRHRRNA